MDQGQNTSLSEKRKFERYITKDRALVFIFPNETPLHVIDISRSGMAFKYLGKELLNVQAEELQLYYEEASGLQGIPFEIVSDKPIKTNSCILFRRCGIKFGKITSVQQKFIDDFINKYTYANA